MSISFETAQTRALENVNPLGIRSRPLLEATGQVLAEDIVAPYNMPPWDNSAMDGFAVRSHDCIGQPSLTVSGYLPAGEPAGRFTVTRGTAIKIMTGAPVPRGCDAIVPIEETEEDGDEVLIKGKVRPGDHIRYLGEDFKHGELAITAGTVLRPAEISLLASFGRTSVDVYRKARVAILSTGDELVEPGETLTPGKIINSNSMALAAAVSEAGAEPVLLGIACDTEESLYEKITLGLQADVLLTSAGISAGDRDLVDVVLHKLNVKPVFRKVQVKPGRPTAFGLWGLKPVFSLPGNPVSSMLTFDQLVRPALLKMMGHRRPLKATFKAKLERAVSKKKGRVHLLRVRVDQHDGQLFATSSGDQNTGIQKTLLKANAIAILPAERENFGPGEEVNIQFLESSPPQQHTNFESVRRVA